MAIHWTTTLNTPPSVEPVSLDDIKAHLRIDTGDEDAYLLRRVKSARRYVEIVTRRQLITATWELHLDKFPRSGTAIRLPYPPLRSVTSIKYCDTDGAEQTWTAAEYRVDTDSEPGRVTEAYDYTWPTTRDMTGAVVVTYSAGYGATSADVPEELRDAIEILVAQWHEFREAVVTGVAIAPVPLSVESLLWHYRVLRFDGPTDE